MKFIVVLFFFILGCASKGPNNTDLAQVHFRVGTNHLEKGLFPDALKELLEAQDLDPKDALIQNNLGLTYFMRERYELAETHLRRAIQINKQFTDARNNLARVLIEQKKYKEARFYLEIVFEDLTYPQPGKAYINLGLSYFREGNFVAAKEAFLKSIGFDRENCLAQNYYGRSLLELNEHAKAIQAFDQATGYCVKVNFDEPIYYSAIAYYRMGDLIKARSRLESLLEKKSALKDKAESMLGLLRD